MRLMTALLLVAAACCGGALGTPRAMLSDLLKATKSAAGSAGGAARSSLQGAADLASGAAKASQDTVQGAVGAATKIVRAVTDKEYYSLKYVLDLYSGCLYTICLPNPFNGTAKAVCEARKKRKCKEMDEYSIMDFLSYHLTQLWLKIAPGAAFNTANSMATSALKMG